MARKKYVKENISTVRDGFSKYLGVSIETPVVITNHNEPQSVLVSYSDFIKHWGTDEKKKNNKLGKKSYTDFSDFIGIANPDKKKIDISKEISDSWGKDF